MKQTQTIFAANVMIYQGSGYIIGVYDTYEKAYESIF
jgi:hypothetical protein